MWIMFLIFENDEDDCVIWLKAEGYGEIFLLTVVVKYSQSQWMEDQHGLDRHFFTLIKNAKVSLTYNIKWVAEWELLVVSFVCHGKKR